MTTRLVYSKGVFGSGHASGGGMSGGSCSLRRGTLAAATWDEGGSIRASVLLDGNDSPSEFGVDWQMGAGQRVAVLFFGAQALVLPVASAIIEQALAQAGEGMQAFVDALEDEIAAAKAEVAGDLAELDSAFEAFKANRQLTDDDIALRIEQTETSLVSQIAGAIQTANEAYEALTALEQTVGEISLTASEKYESYDQGMADLQSRIAVAAAAIAQEVSDRREAVSGAVSSLESLVEQTASGIRSEVAATYATSSGVNATVSTAVTQLEDSLTAEINRVSADAQDAAKTATDFLEYSSSGLTLGRMVNGSYTGYRTRITTGAFQVLDSSENVLSSFGADEVLLGNASTSAAVSLCGGSMTITGSAEGGGGSVRNARGAAYGFSTLDGAESYPLIRSNSGSSSYIVGSTLSATSTTYRQLFGTYCVYSNSSGTTGSITLSASASNSYVKGLVFVYGDGSRYLSETLWGPNGRYVTLSRAVYSSDYQTLYVSNAVYLVSGTAATRQESFSGHLGISSSQATVSQSDAIRVYAVLAIM